MGNEQQHIHRHILTSLTLIRILLLVAPGVAPTATAGEAPPVHVSHLPLVINND